MSSRPGRRAFLRQAGLMLGAFGLGSGVLERAFAAGPSKRRKTLVTLFLRGGVDGLSMVPPVGDGDYAALRPTLRLLPAGGDSPDAVLPLDATFGLHPAMAPLLPHFKAGQLAVVHAVGQARPSRSHFDAQDFLESGLAGKRANDGWLSRAAVALPGEGAALRAVAVQNGLPLSLMGAANAVAFPSLRDFRVQASPQSAGGFESLYAQAVDDALKGAGHDAFGSLATLEKQQLANAPARNGAEYPRSVLGRRMQDIARLIQGDLGVEVVATDAGGFDTHLGQGAGVGQLSLRLRDLGAALNAFAVDLGEQLQDVCVVTVTEFGRTAQENGTRGTDHGTASAMLVLGGGVKGGRVLSDWPGLSSTALHEGRDLKVTTDVRAVLAEVLEVHLQVPKSAKAFPDFVVGGKPRLFG